MGDISNFGDEVPRRGVVWAWMRLNGWRSPDERGASTSAARSPRAAHQPRAPRRCEGGTRPRKPQSNDALLLRKWTPTDRSRPPRFGNSSS